jgi:3-methyladenine DNA glycosylase Mpg
VEQRAEVASTKSRGTGRLTAVFAISGVVALYVLYGYAIYMAVSALF